uniref:Sugar or nucleoside kinase, ribokinase family n=1 Tax=Candidatus Kentrum eta TaxID=2126337 RepID=A0A450UBI4_9GAMM|nr:MAG: Sugar or nucleoside kinase, ribokinase family [Candidatus Kentron sp. H]VFJ91047.1 MAG: Sugar or nucleoside kinase, ribokinase family [Candidatus Kentron sp. H]VFJ97352.1 MAG: Sugar or nucleoside kinase, ribokinase family [Candidatus Kentron sp. H]
MSPTILIIGSVAWDEIVCLDGPLQAGSHNSGSRRETRIGGGAANTAMALAAMASARSDTAPRPKTVVIGAVGNDAQGKALLRALRELGVCVDRIDGQGEHTTRSLVLLEKDGERTVINLTRAPVPLPTDLAHIPAHCCYVRSADPALTPVLERRVEQGLVVAHIPPTIEGFRPARVLVGSASDLDPAFCADPFSAGRRIAGPALEWMVITFGPAGAAAYGDGVLFREPAPKVHAKDTTGAGDVFAAGLAFALAMGEEMPVALETGVRWGTASVGYQGTVPTAEFLEGIFL